MRKKWLLITSLIISIILTASTVVFAWFTVVEKTQPILIYSGSIKQSSILYETTNGDVEVTSSYQFLKVVPGDSFNFRLDIENQGTLDGEIKVVIKFATNNSSLLPFFTLQRGTTSYTLGSISPSLGHEFTIINNIINGQNTDETFNSFSLSFTIIISNTLTTNDISSNNDYVEISSIETTLTQVGVI